MDLWISYRLQYSVYGMDFLLFQQLLYGFQQRFFICRYPLGKLCRITGLFFEGLKNFTAQLFYCSLRLLLFCPIAEAGVAYTAIAFVLLAKIA